MIVARWRIQARFGHKAEALEAMRRWWLEIAPQIGWQPNQVRILTGAVGTRESAIEVEVQLASLSALDEAWERLAEAEDQAAWAKALAPHIVSGTPRWTVQRVVAI